MTDAASHTRQDTGDVLDRVAIVGLGVTEVGKVYRKSAGDFGNTESGPNICVI